MQIYRQFIKVFLFTVVLVSMLISRSQAQFASKLKTAEYGVQYYKGIIIPHHKSINYLTKDYGQTINLTLNLPSFGDKYWHELYKYPDKGFGYSFADFGNPEVLGFANTLYAFVNLPFIRTKRFRLNFDAAAGVSYVSKPFNLASNNTNIIIGSPANAYLRVYLNTKIQVTQKFSLKTGFGISHFSNGAIKKPNRGVNLLSVYTEVAFRPQIKELEVFNKTEKFVQSVDYSVILGAGWRQHYPPYSTLYGIGVMSIKTEYNLSGRHRAGVGLDLFYDEIYSIRTTRQIYENQSSDKAFFSGIVGTYDLVFGNMSFSVQGGYHPSIPGDGYPRIYQRFSLKQRFGKHFVAGFALKSYMGTAQFIEWRVGFLLTQKRIPKNVEI